MVQLEYPCVQSPPPKPAPAEAPPSVHRRRIHQAREVHSALSCQSGGNGKSLYSRPGIFAEGPLERSQRRQYPQSPRRRHAALL